MDAQSRDLLLTKMEDLARKAAKTGFAHSKFLTPRKRPKSAGHLPPGAIFCFRQTEASKGQSASARCLFSPIGARLTGKTCWPP